MQKFLLRAAFVAHLVCWVLPVWGGLTIGLFAAPMALVAAPVIDRGEVDFDSPAKNPNAPFRWYWVAYGLTPFTNVVAWVAFYSMWKRKTRRLRVLCGALVASLALNLTWMGASPNVLGLGAGYFAWVLSFALLAVAAGLRARHLGEIGYR